ncbi:unnamed protein product [Ostreobium quekettii]|uniref:t-SNARE coiled-coil homology domain-containing protein n=1 Tax=Ostreobium quekettii TaxID=121088 RepID=A0A8S1IKR0_9CHLO|nr:unnamed protein product [Ostreobium quekettii]
MGWIVGNRKEEPIRGDRRETAAGGLDAEALEEENDNRIDDLGAKAKFLKQMTDSIRVEVESQHSLLDKVVRNVVNITRQFVLDAKRSCMLYC